MTKLRKPLLIVGISALIIALILNFQFLPGVGRFKHQAHVPNAYVKQELLKADAQFKQGHKKAAIAILQPVVKQYPDEALVNFMLGLYLLVEHVYDENGKAQHPELADEGLGYIKKAVELEPSNQGYLLTYSTILGEVGRDQESVSILEKHFFNDQNNEIRASPKYRYLVFDYASSLVRLGRRDQALAEYKKSLAVTNNDERIAKAYATLLSSPSVPSDKSTVKNNNIKQP